MTPPHPRFRDPHLRGYRRSIAGGGVTLGTVETRVPVRLDRLPWSRFHWLVVIGLGPCGSSTAWR